MEGPLAHHADSASAAPVDGRLDSGVQALGIAVLQQAITDSRGTGAIAAQAQAWLHGDSPILRHWCACAGLGSPAALQRYLRRPTAPVRAEWPPRRFVEEDEAA